MPVPVRVFIGYDQAEARAYHVLSHSILEKATMPVAITPIRRETLGWIFTRERGPFDSTEFSTSRFMVPFLCDYQGWAIFMDCDMLMRSDIAELWKLQDERFAVMCAQHNHVPKEDRKFLGNVQTRYSRKNWTSLMLLNCVRCKALSPGYVNKAPGLDLHQFRWLQDHEIGAVPKGWNHLVGYDHYDPKAKNVHFTIGGPYFDRFRDCDYAREWFACEERALHVDVVANNVKWQRAENEAKTKVRDDPEFAPNRKAVVHEG